MKLIYILLIFKQLLPNFQGFVPLTVPRQSDCQIREGRDEVVPSNPKLFVSWCVYVVGVGEGVGKRESNAVVWRDEEFLVIPEHYNQEQKG